MLKTSKKRKKVTFIKTLVSKTKTDVFIGTVLRCSRWILLILIYTIYIAFLFLKCCKN